MCMCVRACIKRTESISNMKIFDIVNIYRVFLQHEVMFIFRKW